MINIKNLLGFTFYTSPLDQFLIDFDKKNPKLSSSQRAEIKKYARIYKLRDGLDVHEAKTPLWEKF